MKRSTVSRIQRAAGSRTAAASAVAVTISLLGRHPAAAAPAAPVVIGTISANRPAQRLDGFGAATAYYQNWIAAQPYKREIYDTLFKGLNLSILRLQNVWRPGKGADFAKDDSDIVRGARASLGHSIPLLISSWSPPADLKSNGSEKDGGTLARENGSSGGPFVYDRFAQYWSDSLAAYRRAGIVPTWVSIQNEPDWKASWESCLFRPTEEFKDGTAYAGYDRALDAVARRLAAGPDHPKLIGPEPTGIAGNNLEHYVPPANTAERNALYAVAHHLYNGGRKEDGDSYLPALHAIRDAYPDKPKWQSEFGEGNGFQTAWLIHNCLAEENASAYLYWSALWPGAGDGGALIHMDNPWQRGGWKFPHGWEISGPYWAVKHYSYFTAPGWRRVSADTDSRPVKLSAFVSPDGRRLTAVLLNTSPAAPAAVRLDLHGFSAGRGGTHVYRTVFGGAEHFADRGPLPGNRILTLPPHSIATVTFGGSGR